jgi:hypothetical protein
LLPTRKAVAEVAALAAEHPAVALRQAEPAAAHQLALQVERRRDRQVRRERRMLDLQARAPPVLAAFQVAQPTLAG